MHRIGLGLIEKSLGAFLFLPSTNSMLKAESLKHPQAYYLSPALSLLNKCAKKESAVALC
jgi:hypothetical protein